MYWAVWRTSNFGKLIPFVSMAGRSSGVSMQQMEVARERVKTKIGSYDRRFRSHICI